VKSQVNIFSAINQLDNLRAKQVTGLDSSTNSSFTIRSTSSFYKLSNSDRSFWKKKISVELRSFGYLQQENNNIGIGSNDGSLLPSVGKQSRYHFDVSAKWKKIILQLGPEYITGDNKAALPFLLNPQDPNYMARYYLSTVNKIDMYWRFGSSPFSKFSLGQSSLRYQDDNFSFGVSTENIWWGPALHNSLVMSNNATNFPYITFNTVKPLKTKIGSFEGQIIYGNLENPQYEHPDHERMKTIWLAGIAKKDTSDRSIAGFVATWSPKWVKNFYMGLASSTSAYRNSVNRKAVSFPFFTSYKPIKLGSFFLRYNMPKDNAEIYFEFGRADKMATPFNIIKDSIPMGYTAGIRKFMPIFHGKSHFFIGMEITRLELPDPRLVFTPNSPFGLPLTNSWYTASDITQGYTNNGQVIGAWIGPGSNSQTIQFGWMKASKKIIITGQRVQHNNDFYYYNYLTNDLRSNYQNPNKHWADVSATAQFQYNIRNILLSAAWSYTSLINYRWVKLDGGFSGPSKISDRNNTQIYTSAVWFFNKNMLK
jgi:hypothetical protein